MLASVSATNAATGAIASNSGIVLTSSGQVLTSNHGIANASSISVSVGPRSFDARVLGYDVTDDLALLQLTGARGLSAASLAMSPHIVPGDPVVALGASTPPQTAFVVALDQTATLRDGSATRHFGGLLAISAAVQPGAAGGPLLDRNGKVVGVNVTSASGGSFEQQSAHQVGYAIPIADALAVWQQIASGHGGGNVHVGERAVLGAVTVGSRGGADVQSVTAAGPAARAGIEPGDTIASINDATVSSSASLDATLDPFRPGQTVKVGWVDSANQFRFANVNLAAGPPL
jgi:S1-C subfamily serine protease